MHTHTQKQISANTGSYVKIASTETPHSSTRVQTHKGKLRILYKHTHSFMGMHTEPQIQKIQPSDVKPSMMWLCIRS